MKFKRLLSIVLATVLLLTTLGTSVLASEEENPSYEHALALKEAGILYGLPDGTFGLDLQFKRSESIVVLLRSLNLYEQAGKTEYKPIFEDVPEDHWAAPYIIYAYEKGMTNGVSDIEFAPEEYVTAQQFCTLMLRYILDEPEITLDSVFGYIVTQTPLEIEFIEKCFTSDVFTRADMVEIVYVIYNMNSREPGIVISNENSSVVVSTEVSVGDIFYIEVAVNASTGYKWEVEISDGDILAETGRFDYPPVYTEGEDMMAGVPGLCVYQFTALSAGSAVIKMSNVAPGDQPEETEVFEYEIIVK